MHELALTEAIIRIINSQREKEGFSRVEEIRLRIGEYSGIVPEYLLNCFPIAAKGTVAEGAALVLETLKASFRCSGSATTTASTRQPGMIVFLGRVGVFTIRSTCTMTLPLLALTAWQIESASPDMNWSSKDTLPFLSAAVPLMSATVSFGSL
jgi:hydrogenase nickel insertion protein HypA